MLRMLFNLLGQNMCADLGLKTTNGAGTHFWQTALLVFLQSPVHLQLFHEAFRIATTCSCHSSPSCLWSPAALISAVYKFDYYFTSASHSWQLSLKCSQFLEDEDHSLAVVTCIPGLMNGPQGTPGDWLQLYINDIVQFA
jgi:hypothetical protein